MILYNKYTLVEVAFDISTGFDAAGAEEDPGKGRTPKEYSACGCLSWECGEEPQDCHRKMGRYREDKEVFYERRCSRRFYFIYSGILCHMRICRNRRIYICQFLQAQE